ncbi:MAG: cation:proton antiporter [Anaerolineales bacterium]
MEAGLTLLLALIVIYTLISLRLGKISITMPMFFVVLGAVFGAFALGWIQFSISTTLVGLLTELTLGLLLFADASTLDFDQIRDEPSLPARLLLIALPLVILLGALVAFLMFPGQGIGFAFLVASILAPTDAALGLAIFNNPRVPVRIRRALNVESGLNDGIATPLVTFFLALNLEEMEQGQFNFILPALSEITIGIVVGVLLGLLGGWLFATAKKKGWTTRNAMLIGNPALAILIYRLADSLGGNSFVAVFTAGLLFGYITRHQLHEATEYTEITGTLLSITVWTIFGAALVIPLFVNFNLRAFIYALLSLTVIRMIPVAISLIRKHLRLDTILMMGWLGPRGLASVVFLILARDAAVEAQVSPDLLTGVVAWTILLSVILHGATALPLANWYGARMEKVDPGAAELIDVREIQVRGRRTFSEYIHPSGS